MSGERKGERSPLIKKQQQPSSYQAISREKLPFLDEEGNEDVINNIIHNSDLLTSYYELRDVRVPEPMTGLDFFYAFYLLVGVQVGTVQEDKHRLITGVEEIDNDNDEMMGVGAAPSPNSRRPFNLIFPLFTPIVQRILFMISLLCLFFYASVHLAHAARTDFPFLRSLFVLFEMCSVISSLLLASDILTNRLVGTRVFYTLNSYANPARRLVLKHQMGAALMGCVGLNLILPFMGILDDLVITKNQPTPDDLFFLADYHAVLVPFWEFCSVIVNIQLVCGVTVFAGISSIYLVRIHSCARLLKQPNTRVKDCFSELFDLDVSLADLSGMLDFRLSVMLISSFLTFFFQSIFLSNSGVDFSEGVKSLMSFLHPALICFFILGTTGAINANIKMLKLVAYRFAILKEKLSLDRKRKRPEQSPISSTKGGGERGGENEGEEDNNNNNKRILLPQSSKIVDEVENPTLVSLIERDEATVGDEEVFEAELESLKNYLQESTIGVSLVGFQLDESFTWGFLVLSMSSVMSLTNLDKLNFM